MGTKKIVTGTVYWSKKWGGKRIGKFRIAVKKRGKGTLIRDGRTVVKRKGKWIYNPK